MSIMNNKWTIEQDRTKVCISCKKEKSVEEFVWMPSSEDNRNNICRDCSANNNYHFTQIKTLLNKINNETIKRFKS